MACEFIEARVLSAAGGRHACRHPAEADRQTTVTPGTLAQAASFTLPDLQQSVIQQHCSSREAETRNESSTA